MSRKALGRGLRALIPESEESAGSARPVAIDQIDRNPDQPRKHFDEDRLAELTASVSTHGVLEPIIVRPTQGRYELVVGERRYRAALAAGLEHIPAIIRSLSDLEALELALVENIQREDLNPIEEAETYKRLMDEFHLTQEDVARRVGKKRSTVANSLRLLEIEPELKQYVSKGTLSAGHAKALLSATSKTERMRLAEKTIQEGLSVRALEALTSGTKERRRPVRAPAKTVDPLEAAIEDRLQQALGTKVRLVRQGQRGHLEIDYYSDAELERIVDMLDGA